ncbi:polyprenyl synthetase family protein [Pyxidicoccus parkwayensis]|uniref:Polyprenyl synthetase family protein n=1 Tax=Pyxidicoccus parkwayensis TaxID=2813578 RepID=A0ABX7NY02_9BACT|nr:polyprenyl synthetase family protein [Pyxidicoccus parkwaysis]QSQ22357.1 polyprenyl synthetase family protein [Pyxidicoccus parkwaysis]
MSTPEAAQVREKLAEYGAAAREGMRHYLRGRSSDHAFQELVADYPERGGRSLRASLCIATARAFGAPTAEALNSAVSLELLHNAFLVHDDVEDESEQRRGRPTLHRGHGTPLAVHAGDALSALSLQPLLDNVGTLGTRLALRVLQEAERMTRESVEGQTLELWWRQHNVMELHEGDYLRMVLKKTCWYTTIHPLRVGALIGTRDRVDLDRYLRFGFFVGAAFQIQDDLLNLEGDEASYGKELAGDLLEGKRTLMLLHFFHAQNPEGRVRLSRLLSQPRAERREEELRWVRDGMDTHGSITFARQVAHGLAGAARHEFSRAYGDLRDSPDKRFLEALPSWVLERA